MSRLDWVITTPVDDEYVRTGVKDGHRRPVVDAIRCADGTSVSVQASRTHYCSPRNDYGPWLEVEVGFPSVKPPSSWKKFADDWKSPTETVYVYVPIEYVRRFIKAHGGEAA